MNTYNIQLQATINQILCIVEQYYIVVTFIYHSPLSSSYKQYYVISNNLSPPTFYRTGRFVALFCYRW